MIQAQNKGINSLVEENEYHLKSIEAMAKQLDLYKSKTGSEVDKKVSLLESRAKKEAKKFKGEAKYLNEVMECKDNKIRSLEEEIERLKLITRTQARLDKRIEKSVLEQRVDEIVSNGKLEYKVYITKDVRKARIHDLNKVLDYNLSSLFQTHIVQAKMIDNWVQKLKTQEAQALNDYNPIKATVWEDKRVEIDIEEIEAQKQEVDKRISEVLIIEEILNRRFEEIVSIVEEYLTSHPRLKEVKQRLNDLKNLKNNLPNKRDIRTSDKSITYEESHTIRAASFEELKELMERGDIENLANIWKQGGYEVNECSKEVIEMLQMLCKYKDKEIEDKTVQLQGEVKLQKCLELKNGEILELMTDYEEIKSKYLVATNVKIKELQEENKTLAEKIVALEHELKESALLLDEKTKEAKNDAATIKFSHKDNNDKGLEGKIKELEERLLQKKRLKRQKDASPKLTLSKNNKRSENNYTLGGEINQYNSDIEDKAKELLDKLSKEHNKILSKLNKELRAEVKETGHNPSDTLIATIKNEISIAREILKYINELTIVKENNKVLPEKIERLEYELSQFKQEVGKVKDSIEGKVTSQLESSGGQKLVERYQASEWQKQIEELVIKCNKLEEELIALNEFKFQYAKQREELSAKDSTIESLRSKLMRLEEVLNNKQSEHNKLKREVEVAEEKVKELDDIRQKLSVTAVDYVIH